MAGKSVPELTEQDAPVQAADLLVSYRAPGPLKKVTTATLTAYVTGTLGPLATLVPGTGVATALGINVGSAGAFTAFNGAGGTPSSLTLTNATNLPISTGISGLGTGVATALAISTGSAGAFLTSTEVAASGGSALVGFLQSGVDAVARTLQSKMREYVSITDFGASTANTPAQNTLAIQAALYSGNRNILVPLGTFEVNSFAFGDGIKLFGMGEGSRLKNMTAANVDFISIIDVTNCSISDIWIDGNRSGRTGGFVATAGANVRVINTEIADTPRINNIHITNTKNTDAGFVGIFMNNAHTVFVTGNYITGDTDTAIAACVGSSGVVISDNICTGYSFGISLSSDGNADLATTGYVRNCTVTGNIINNSKTGGYGIQGDGLRHFTMTGNLIRMLGVAY